MGKLEKSAVIKYFYLKDLPPFKIKKIDSTLKVSSLSYSTIKEWFSEFKKSRKSTADEPRSGRSAKVTTPEMIQKIHKIVLEDRRVKVTEIDETVKMSTECLRNVLHNLLGVQKLCARWVLRLLTHQYTRHLSRWLKSAN